MPEYLTCEDRTPDMAEHIVGWLTDPAARQERVAQLTKLKDRLAQGGASSRAAEYILRELSNRQVKSLRTHYRFAAQMDIACRGAA